MPKILLVPTICALLCVIQTQVIGAQARNSMQSSKTASLKSPVGQKSRSARRYYGFVPPPPPTAVSPTVLALYPNLRRSAGASLPFIPSKPHNLAEDMKLTAVVDDVAFFKLRNLDESIHLKAGGSYETVTVANVNADQVVLEEKGLQFVKHLR
jgi:hypothetical protein